MDELTKQVLRAHRRLLLQRFLSALTWSLFGWLLIAALAILAPKIWALDLDGRTWLVGWLGGALAMGAASAFGVAYGNRRTPLDAAIEIDRRFGLKERVSSAFALGPDELSTAAGQALVEDASRRVARLDVGEQFRTQGSWWNALPLVPAGLLFLLAGFIPDAIAPPATANAAVMDVRKQIKNTTNELKKKLAEQRKEAEEKDLEAAKLLTELEQGVGDLNRLKDVDKKKALVKLNDLSEEIQKRRAEIGDMSKLQKQLNQLKNLKPGPASEMAKAMKAGDFDKAISELNNMKNELAKGTMGDNEREALAKQLTQMASKMQQQVEAHEMAKEELKKQIDQAKQQGDNAKAGELQRKMDQLQSQNQQMKQMQKMAQKLTSASKAAADGKSQEAAQQMEALASDLEALKSELEELDMLDEAMEQLANAKDMLNCDTCDGMGCPTCLGSGDGMAGRMPGMGMNEGRGQGPRPEAETDSNFYDSQVRGNVGKGKAVVTGLANGRNIAGDAQEEIRQALQSSGSDGSDPLTNVRLPKEHRDHAREYFEAFQRDD